jgi:tellurite resistance protein
MSNLPSDKKIKLEHFANLVAVAYSDGYLEEHEKQFLSERAEEYGLPTDEVKKLFDMAAELKFVVPQNDEEKEEQLSDAVYMAMIDGEVHEKEYDLCLTIAKKLDFRKKDLDYVIELTKKLWK